MSLGGAPTNSEEQERYVGRVRAEQQGRHCAVSGANGPATVTVAAQGAGRHAMFMWVHWSYTAQPTNGRLTITDGVTNYRVDITDGGPGFLPFDGVRWAENRAVTVTLAAGGAGVTGCINVLGARAVTD
jgi:hypothetical protein